MIRWVDSIAWNCAEAMMRKNPETRRLRLIKVVMAWEPDLACTTLRAGYDKLYIDPFGRFDRAELC